ncbi:hypothetical protein B0H34DRAFT_857931 [Crassisporium funariophilum]|nr:hypothetical protein B0H34DRAFT_857931 [Crassisporium funariophilum]
MPRVNRASKQGHHKLGSSPHKQTRSGKTYDNGPNDPIPLPSLPGALPDVRTEEVHVLPTYRIFLGSSAHKQTRSGKTYDNDPNDPIPFPSLPGALPNVRNEGAHVGHTYRILKQKEGIAHNDNTNSSSHPGELPHARKGKGRNNALVNSGAGISGSGIAGASAPNTLDTRLRRSSSSTAKSGRRSYNRTVFTSQPSAPSRPSTPPAPHSRDPLSTTVLPSMSLSPKSIAMQVDGPPLAESEMDGKDVDVLVQDGKD